MFLSFSKSLCVLKDLIYSAHRKVHYIRRRVAAEEQERERERKVFQGCKMSIIFCSISLFHRTALLSLQAGVSSFRTEKPFLYYNKGRLAGWLTLQHPTFVLCAFYICIHPSSRRRIPLSLSRSLTHTQRARPNDDGTISDLILSIVVSLKDWSLLIIAIIIIMW